MWSRAPDGLNLHLNWTEDKTEPDPDAPESYKIEDPEEFANHIIPGVGRMNRQADHERVNFERLRLAGQTSSRACVPFPAQHKII